MPDDSRVRLGLGALALVIGAGGSLASPAPAPSVADAATAPPTAPPNSVPLPITRGGVPIRTPAGRRLNPGQPTPYPIVTLAPPGQATSLPYPAYGTPVPGVDAGVAAPDIPPTLALQQAIAIGFARSPSLEAARADVGVQAAAVRLAGSGLLPALDGSVGFTRSHDQSGVGVGNGTTTGGIGTTGRTGDFSNVSSATFGITLRQLIYDGGRIAAAVKAAQRSETAFADTYRRDLQTVANNVAQSYYAYLSAQRTTQVDLEIVRQDVVQEDLVRAQIAAGTEARAQLATVQLPTAQARLAVVRSQGAELSAEAQFANAMGLDANLRVQPVDDAPVFTNSQVSSIPIPTYDLAVRRALALRPDFDQSVQTVEQSKYSLKNAALGQFPTLSGTATANDNSSDTRAGSFRNSQSLGVALSLPFYDQGVTAANVASARAQLAISQANLQNTALGVQLSVKQALVNLVSSRAAFNQTQQEYATAVVNVQSTQAQYRAGVTTLPLLLNAQVQLSQAQTDQVTAVYAFREAEQTYLYSVGANYETPVGNVPLVINPTPNPQPTGTAPPPSASASPVVTGSPLVIPPASPQPTVSPAQAPAASPSPAPRRRRLF